MRFVDKDGVAYEANTKMGLALELYDHARHWIPTLTMYDFMEGCSVRIFNETSIDMDFADPNSFVDELIKYNFIKEIN